MKRQIRNGVFETNSSSTHSLTICTEEEYAKWKANEFVYDNYNEELIPCAQKESNILASAERSYERASGRYWKSWDEISNEEKDAWVTSYKEEFSSYPRFESYDSYTNNDDLAFYERYFETPSGDKMVVFGQYGYEA